LVLSKEVEIKWSPLNKNHYLNKGYVFTKMHDTLIVKIEDLTNSCTVLVEVKCDNQNCEDNHAKFMIWRDYFRRLRDNNKYFCNKCASKLYRVKNIRKTILENSITFEQWCLENNYKDVLERWDYELNDCKPSEITYRSGIKYYFKCPRGLHESELKLISNFTNHNGSIFCHKCNSFAQYLIDNFGDNALDKYWDYKKNTIVPWNIDRGSSSKKVYIKCQENECHGSYNIRPNDFINSYRCPECQSSKGEIRIINYLIDNNFIKISQENYNILTNVNIYNYYISQKEFHNLVGLGNGNLSYDFFLPSYNLLIEYQGEQHEKYIKGFHKSKRDFEKQLEHDRRKRQFAQDNNIYLLEIWYWDFDNIEKILEKELNLLNKGDKYEIISK
jgi:Zn finger protein HypA/HybF involved in hydrogenase expression